MYFAFKCLASIVVNFKKKCLGGLFFFKVELTSVIICKANSCLLI